MKSMTCRQLGGACDEVFKANSWMEMQQLSRAHGQEMFKAGDKDHLNAMNKMRELMHDPNAMQRWMNERKSEFDALPNE